MSKIAFVFPGQGAQYVGMGKELAKEFSEVNAVFDRANERLSYDLKKMCFEGPKEELQLTINTQPALLTMSIACLKMLDKTGIRADYVLGHSLGEYSALVAAGVISFEDATWLVSKRGQYMQEAVPNGQGSMAAILGATEEEVLNLCRLASKKGVVEPANYNSPGQIVISGEKEAVDEAISLAKDFGAKRALPLKVSGPFHSSLLKPASLKLAQEIEKVEIKDPSIALVANVNAKEISSKDAIKESLVLQVYSAVKWEQSIRYLLEKDVDTFIEIGAGRVLSGLIKKIDRKARVLNIEDKESFTKTLDNLKGEN